MQKMTNKKKHVYTYNEIMYSIGTHVTFFCWVDTCRIHGNSIQRWTSGQSAATWNNRDENNWDKMYKTCWCFYSRAAVHLRACWIYAFVICTKTTWHGKCMEKDYPLVRSPTSHPATTTLSLSFCLPSCMFFICGC